MKKLALSIALAGLALAQMPRFEVAAIHSAKQDGDHDSDTNNGFFQTHNLTLKRLIANAWEIDEAQVIGGPSWIDSDGWDIAARIPTQFAHQTREKVPQMLQSLLADRFRLIFHRQPREISGYALVVARKGPKMERAKPGQEGSHADSNKTHLTAKNVTMEALAKRLSRNRDIGKLVVDRTGLTGGYNFELNWISEGSESKSESTSDDRTSIFTALQEQLGLRLESARVSAQVLVVDHAEKPTDN